MKSQNTKHREVHIKQLRHDKVTAATKSKSESEETARKLLALRQEVRRLCLVSSLVLTEQLGVLL